MAASAPKYSNLEECNWCAIAWTSFEISTVCPLKRGYPPLKFWGIGEFLLNLFKPDYHNRQSLTNIIVQISRDPVSFPLFSINEPAVYAGK